MADSPYRVKRLTPTTVTVKMGNKLQLLLRYRVSKALKPDAHIRGMDLKDGSVTGDETEKQLDGEMQTEPGPHDGGYCNEVEGSEKSAESTTDFVVD